MGRVSKKLSALEVGRLSEPGTYPVGESLYLQISATGTKSWLFRYSFQGKPKWMGLGSFRLMSLAEARKKVADLQMERLSGHNPLALRIAKEKEIALLEAKKMTFEECARRYIEAHSPTWKNQKHISQWNNTLETYVFPIFGHLSVEDVDTSLVMKALEPIWMIKAETANRLRGRIERILSWATVRGFRSGKNPADWRGHLDQLLPKRSSIAKVEHFKALPFAEMNSFIENLRKNEGIAALALEFCILTVSRTSECMGAKWSEVNFNEKYWLVPAERMKAKKEHKVPLSPRALGILEQMRSISEGEFIFPGRTKNKPLSNMAFLSLLRRMKYDVTAHGFRSSFRDWAEERTNFPSNVVEMALAHTVKNKVEAAYRRGDLFMKRQLLMNAWETYCNSPTKAQGQVLMHPTLMETI